ncbi:hypothetical protein ACOSP7_026416 [Xanthoceras sorbifolium]
MNKELVRSLHVYRFVGGNGKQESCCFWLCIFVFVADSPPALNHIPPPLLVSGNAKLKSIPTLANDMKMIFQLNFQADEIRSSSHRERDGDRCPHFRRNRPEFVQDLNCLPNSVDMCEYHAKEEFEQCATGNMLRERRAASEDVQHVRNHSSIQRVKNKRRIINLALTFKKLSVF